MFGAVRGRPLGATGERERRQRPILEAIRTGRTPRAPAGSPHPSHVSPACRLARISTNSRDTRSSAIRGNAQWHRLARPSSWPSSPHATPVGRRATAHGSVARFGDCALARRQTSASHQPFDTWIARLGRTQAPRHLARRPSQSLTHQPSVDRERARPPAPRHSRCRPGR